MSSALKPRPLDLSHDVHLSGVFAPVDEEVDHDDLEVEGSIPDDLVGAYLRNGPNPKFPPLGSYTYPLDGDGMIHGIWLEDGRARYRNRYVMTKGLAAEVRAGRALWGGVMTPVYPSPDLVGPDPDPGGDKYLPDINVIRHAGRYLALGEGIPPYRITPELTTVGRDDFGGQLPLGMCAHPRIDPVTGEMFVFRYGFEDPFLYWATLGADGTLTHAPDSFVEVDRTYMVHDFVVTEDYLVIFLTPALLDLAAAMSGGNPLAWKPDLGTRIAVVPRNGTSNDVRWIETDPFFAWHWAGAYQDGDQIVTHFPWWSHFGMAVPDGPRSTGNVACARLDVGAGTARIEVLDDRVTEFPRVDDRRSTRPYRFMTLSGHSGSDEATATGLFDTVLRYDLESGAMTSHHFPGGSFGEAVFAPRAGSDDEDEGYVITFVNDVATGRSSFVILDAGAIDSEPVATVRLPTRVPEGLHGSWFPAES